MKKNKPCFQICTTIILFHMEFYERLNKACEHIYFLFLIVVVKFQV